MQRAAKSVAAKKISWDREAQRKAKGRRAFAQSLLNAGLVVADSQTKCNAS
jgi:hypothetical protein